ncbi:hypothetical protein E4Q08_03325 [Candidatus Accumulibacter phosphatis]|uniref:Uncharacterized protein n=1 Tax=Candidatus Accumulibacter contiguus TaxID=2954381 RepID=A0ABX1T723_9PROT|nr:hypothetical protein [Candidatus Accumulibacter contiguus]
MPKSLNCCSKACT